MFSPVPSDMPQLVDNPTPPFYPPPQGAADGGEPGFFSAFPGVRNQQQNSSPWPPPLGTPYPGSSSPWPQQPNSAPAASSPWSTYPGYPPAGTPMYPPNTQYLAPPAPSAQPQPWTYTPAGTNLNTTTGYPAGPAQWNPPTPYFTGNPPPSTPYDSTTPVMPTFGGWFNNPQQQQQQQPQSAGATGGYYVTRKKSKRRNSGYGYFDNDVEDDDGYLKVKVKRSHSHKDGGALGRSASWGNAGAYGPDWVGTPMSAPPPYSRGDLWDEENLARRPRDWRADFSGRDGIAGYLPTVLPSIMRPKTNVKDWADTEKREIHPLLAHRTIHPPIQFDLRLVQQPFDPSLIYFPTLGRPHNDIDMAQLACQPSAQFLRLMHPRLPWYIEVYPSHPNGITIYDIFSTLSLRMGTPIHGRHFWNEALTAGDRAMITGAFQERCKGRFDLVPRGVLQVDFLGDRCIFEGLSRGTKGVWEIKTSRV